MALSVKRFGWKPDLPDQRDKFYRAPGDIIRTLPPSVDLRAEFPVVWNQEDLGSCTAHATCGQCWFVDKTDPVEPSRLFVYYNTRVLEGTVREDSGASIRNSIKSVVNWGFCPELAWPYDITKFTHKPVQKAFKEAKLERVSQYARVAQNANSIKAALVQRLPVNFGFTVYSSFDSESCVKKGLMPLPEKGESVLGGHAVLIVGYFDDREVYIVRNSWGQSWGDGGYFYMPYSFAHSTKYAADFWIVKAVP